jgi:excisionase family DNA binding protein
VLTVKQAAELLSVSPALVYALVAQGRIEHERYGLGRGTIRIRKEAIDAYRARARVTPAKAQTPPSPTGYRQLNADRLAAAWRERGIANKSQAD